MSQLEDASLIACAREPIRVPGAIQPHGLLLALSLDGRRLTYVSENLCEVVQTAPMDLLGRDLSALFEAEDVQTLCLIVSLEDMRFANPLSRLRLKGAPLQLYQGIAHRNAQAVILELEPSVSAGPAFFSFYHSSRSSLMQLQSAKSLAALLTTACDQIQNLTGFDKVMLYQFDAAWNGTVVAEVTVPELPSYLDLRFPAADIPAQARQLYELNWLRLIVDVDYQPSLLRSAESEPLDLSQSTLRSVSPVHLEYLRNMGVKASMSISIMKDGRLWGLIACHHRAPRFVDYQARVACEFLGQVLSQQIGVQEERAEAAERTALRTCMDRVAAVLAEHTIGDDLANLGHSLLTIGSASGAALVMEKRLSSLGDVPDVQGISQLTDWLDEHEPAATFATETLADVLPDLATPQIAGCLAVRLSRSPSSYLLWFRPEVTRTVRWSGNPDKSAGPGVDQVGRLRPRRSFAAWSETVRGRSLPWRKVEVDIALELRTTVLAAALRDANRDLVASNRELDSFADIVAHDLKEPVRGIISYGSFLIEDEGASLSAGALARLNQIKQLASSSEAMLESLYQYSRVGRVELAMMATDLGRLVDRAGARVHPYFEQRGVRLELQRELPTLLCDRIRVVDLFYNLMLNGAKYNDKESKLVQVGSAGVSPSGEPILFVRDNGIGIPAARQAEVFGLYRRLHRDGEFGGGTGLGLAIVKRIIERHHGDLWLTSKMGEGTTFFFTLAPSGRSS